MIGDGTGLNYYCLINAHENVTIGENTILGQNVKIYDHDHIYKSLDEIKTSGFVTKPVIIGDNVWIGSDCIILSGSDIGSNSVIAAGTIIKGVIPENSMVFNRRELVTRKIEYNEQTENDKKQKN